MKLCKGLIQIIYANILNLIISLGNGFLVPKYLSVESYADLKTFLMYISYIGILHFGYIDGVYIKYGGKDLGEIRAGKLVNDKKVLSIFQLGVSLLIMIIACFLKNLALLLAAISVLPRNMVAFYKLVYQATGKFKEYRYITNLTSFLVFAGNMLLLFLFKANNALFYIGMQVFMFWSVWIFYEKKNTITGVGNKIVKGEIRTRIRENTRLGVIIMLGNFAGIWICNLDRWFVKFFCDITEFAYYSFAVTTLNIINVVAIAFSVTLYNFFCKEFGQEEVCKLRKMVLMVGAVLIAIIFPLDFFIQWYLEKYVASLSVIRILFATQFVMIVINSIYLNLYKALNFQRKYLMKMVVITIVAFLLNLFLGYFSHYSIISYAVATLLTSLIWLVLCQADFPQYEMNCMEWIYIFLTIMGYFVCNYFNEWFGMGIYVCWILLITFLLFPKEIKFLIRTILKIKVSRR